MTGLVYSRESEFTNLLDLSVNDAVRCADIRKPRTIKTSNVDFVSDDLASKPIAAASCQPLQPKLNPRVDLLIIGITSIQENINILVQQFFDRLHSSIFPIVVTSSSESFVHRLRGFREILECANGGLDFRGVEIIDVELVGEGVGHQLADIILVAV